MGIKKNDFIELDYIARIKNTNQIFDLTDEKIAKENNIHHHGNYGPVIICVGQRELVPGLDTALIDKEPGSYKFELQPGEAFGNRDGKLIRIVPTSVFKKKDIQPFTGLQVNIDNSIGTIRSVSGGRTIVDFNHPLAGKALIYEVNIIRILDNDEEKLQKFIKNHFNTEASLKDGIAVIKLDIPEQLQKIIGDRLKDIIPSIKEFKFESSKKEEVKETAKQVNKAVKDQNKK